MTSDLTSTKAPSTEYPIDPLIAKRWSPRGFDPDQLLSHDEIGSLLEAARWSPSANNVQPWRFAIAPRGSADHESIVRTLEGSNVGWAPSAALLIVACARTADEEGRPYRWAVYDLGQSVAWMTVQAESMGLSVHQMAGFDRDAVTQSLSLPEYVEPVTVVAVGRFDPDADLPEALREREMSGRERRGLADIVLRGWAVSTGQDVEGGGASR